MKRYLWIPILLAAATLAASCGDNTEQQTKETVPASAGPDPVITEESEEDYFQVIGDHDFGGKTFSIVYSAEQLGPTWPYDAASENGDVLNDAVFRRNSSVMDRYNCRIVYDDKGGDWDKQILHSATRLWPGTRVISSASTTCTAASMRRFQTASFTIIMISR
ncbi:MAG: hypothetical protein MJ175_07395 [Clostridia bacterium]|nr:hypothetical protein [Clostridia bacterium]